MMGFAALNPSYALAIMSIVMSRRAILSALIAIFATATAAAPVEQQVTFTGAGGITLAGTLVLPESASADRPVPALLLIQGSGPTDRDGNQLPNLRTDLLRQIAQLLAGQNVASLRYDKRGMHANSASLPKLQDELPRFFSWDAFVGDARAAVTYLAAHPALAPTRVGVFGHSEGGLIALAMVGTGPRPKLLVLTGTPGRPLGEIIHDQVSSLLDRQGAMAEQRKFFLDADERIRAQILASGEVPPDIPAGLAALYPKYLGPFYKSLLALDPAALAVAFQGPILVINGGADDQVSASRDAARFAAALAGRTDGSEVFTPGRVSHALKTVTAPDDRSFGGPVDARVRDVVARWLKERL